MRKPEKIANTRKPAAEQAEGQCACGEVTVEIDVPARWAWHDHGAATRLAQGCAYATYVGDDPVDKTDPSGNDEVDVFRPIEITGGYADHEAEFVGNNQSGWTYISKDGAVGGGASGPSTYTIRSFSSLKSGLAFATQQKYTSAFHHDASPKQDAANVKAATAATKSNYDVLKCNCGQAVGAGERAANTPGYRGSSPNPKDAAKFEASPQGQKAGWTPVALPPPPPPPPPPPKPLWPW